jgi:hypothetical protein
MRHASTLGTSDGEGHKILPMFLAIRTVTFCHFAGLPYEGSRFASANVAPQVTISNEF